jgi:hypothetical protein
MVLAPAGESRRVRVGSASCGNAESMTERDPATSLEHDADELEHHLDELDDHISEARKAADARREDLDPADAGDDDAPASAPGPTPGDADGGDD